MQQHLMNLLMGSAGALLLSAVARALPAPVTLGSRLYAWFYQFVQILFANFDKVQIENDVQSSSH